MISSVSGAPSIDDLVGVVIEVQMDSGTSGLTLQGFGDPAMNVFGGVPGVFGISSGNAEPFVFSMFAFGTHKIMVVTLYAWTAGLAFDICCQQFGNNEEITPGSGSGRPVAYAPVNPLDLDNYPDGNGYYRDPMILLGAPGYSSGDLAGTLVLDWSGSGGIEFVELSAEIDKVEIVPEPLAWHFALIGAGMIGLLRMRKHGSSR